MLSQSTVLSAGTLWHIRMLICTPSWPSVLPKKETNCQSQFCIFPYWTFTNASLCFSLQHANSSSLPACAYSIVIIILFAFFSSLPCFSACFLSCLPVGMCICISVSVSLSVCLFQSFILLVFLFLFINGVTRSFAIIHLPCGMNAVFTKAQPHRTLCPLRAGAQCSVWMEWSEGLLLQFWFPIELRNRTKAGLFLPLLMATNCIQSLHSNAIPERKHKLVGCVSCSFLCSVWINLVLALKLVTV